MKRLQPSIHLKAFTAVEIFYFHKKYGLPIAEVITRLRAAGLDSIPGGGAEIFAARVRKKICDDKCTADEWLEVHRTAHRLGLRSNCTMLYGTIETRRGARRSHAAPARAAGRDGRLPDASSRWPSTPTTTRS